MGIDVNREKQKALEKFKELLSDAKEKLLSAVKNAVETHLKSIFEQVKNSLPIDQVLAAIEKIKGLIQIAQKIYSNIVSAAEIAKAAVLGTQETVIEGLKQSAKKFKESKLNFTGFSINFGEIDLYKLFAFLKQGQKPDNSNLGLFIQTGNAKVKLKSIDELVKVVETVNKKLSSEDPAATRSWVHKLSKMHPKVDERIKDLEHFKDISDDVGSTYLQHTPDTQTLALEDWETELPNPFRRMLESKVGLDYNRINEIYFELNKGMVRNISTEFFYERRDDAQMNQGFNWLNKDLLSNDYHIAGDYTFREDHVGLLEQVLMTALISYVGGAGKLISWLSPVSNYERAIKGGIEIKVEGKDVVVDLKGNKIGVIASVINETPIKLETCR